MKLTGLYSSAKAALAAAPAAERYFFTERRNMSTQGKKRLSGAMAFITLMGIVSLFSDMTHEGARSILGEYLNLAGASARRSALSPAWAICAISTPCGSPPYRSPCRRSPSYFTYCAYVSRRRKPRHDTGLGTEKNPDGYLRPGIFCLVMG